MYLDAYIHGELRKMMGIGDISIKYYVVADNELVEITSDIMSLSKNLSGIKSRLD